MWKFRNKHKCKHSFNISRHPVCKYHPGIRSIHISHAGCAPTPAPCRHIQEMELFQIRHDNQRLPIEAHRQKEASHKNTAKAFASIRKCFFPFHLSGESSVMAVANDECGNGPASTCILHKHTHTSHINIVLPECRHVQHC